MASFDAVRPSPSITPNELAEALGRVQLIDVREPFEAQIARIDGATLIPLGSLGQSLDAIRTDLPVVVHCHHDARSRLATSMLQQHGFTDVRWLEGGIDAWAQQVDPAVARY